MGLILLLSIGAAIWLALGTLGILHRLTHPARLTYGVAVARQLPVSPAELGMDPFEDTPLTLPDGQTTPAWIIQGGNPAGPAVVISHGWGHSRFGVLPWARLMYPYASAIILYDLRGQGESSAKRTALGTTETDDLLAIVRQHVPQGRPVVLAGQSMGAGISIVAAAKATPEDRIVGVIGEGVYRLGMQPIEGYFKRKGWPIWPFWPFVAGHLAFWYIPAKAFDRARHAAKLQCPLLLFHTVNDVVCPIHAAQDIAKAAGASATLVTFEQGEHLNLADVDPHRYSQALQAFFNHTLSKEGTVS